MILADTSVWVDHFRVGDTRLSEALLGGTVCHHPFVTGELACGNLRNRKVVLELLRELPVAPVATDAEALRFIEDRSLMGRGIGYIDVHLLASVALSGTSHLWTRDQRLAAVAEELGLAFIDPRKGKRR